MRRRPETGAADWATVWGRAIGLSRCRSFSFRSKTRLTPAYQETTLSCNPGLMCARKHIVKTL